MSFFMADDNSVVFIQTVSLSSFVVVVEGHLGWVHLFTVVNCAVLHTDKQMSLSCVGLQSLG